MSIQCCVNSFFPNFSIRCGVNDAIFKYLRLLTVISFWIMNIIIFFFGNCFFFFFCCLNLAVMSFLLNELSGIQRINDLLLLLTCGFICSFIYKMFSFFVYNNVGIEGKSRHLLSWQYYSKDTVNLSYCICI